jgi:hypothetical protein
MHCLTSFVGSYSLTFYRSMKVLNHVPGASRHASERLRDTVIEDGLKRGQGWYEAAKLVSTLTGAGFGRVYEDVFSSDRISGLRGEYSDTFVGALAGAIEMFKRNDDGKGYWSSGAATDLLKEANRELEDGKIYFRVELIVVYAQKA